MNTAILKSLLNAELFKFENRPIELELFAARFYCAVLESAYKPPELEVQVKKALGSKKILAEVKARKPYTRTGTPVTRTCKFCGDAYEYSGGRQKSCSEVQNPACNRYKQAKAKYDWYSRNSGKGKPYITFVEFKQKHNIN